LRTFDNISVLSFEPFGVLETRTTESTEEKNSPCYLSLSSGDLINNETQLSFMIKDGESVKEPVLNCITLICRSDDATIKIMSNMFAALNASRMETEVWKRIAARLTDLNLIFDEENHEREDWQKYFSTSKLLVNVLQNIKLDKFPLIGIADDGQVGASWYGKSAGELIFVLPSDKSDVSISYIDKNGKLLPIHTNIDELENKGVRSLLPEKEALPWCN